MATQLAFVVGAATRFGMDMAAVRRVAIEVGKGAGGEPRAIVRIAVTIALVVVGGRRAVGVRPRAGDRLVDERTAGAYPRGGGRADLRRLVAQVYLGGSRGLKIMSHTLYAYWIGQSISWIVFTLHLVGRVPQDRRA